MVVHARQDDRDDHGELLPITVDGLRGLAAGPPVSVPVVDDDPPPVVSVGAAETTASPLLPVAVALPVRLDRATTATSSSTSGPRWALASTTVPAGSRTAELQLTVPVGTPQDRPRQVPVRVDGADPTVLVVHPPSQTRAEAVRAAFAAVTWPRLRLPHLF